MLDPFDSPASPLANCFSGQNIKPELIIVSGPPGAGKSSWCQGFAKWARATGAVIGGFISPPVVVEGQKVGIDLVDQLSGERRHLAVRRLNRGPGTSTPKWRIDLRVLSWADRNLVDLPPCDCLILDELGPLEFLHKQGLQTGLELVDRRRAPLTVVVIRPKLLPLAEEQWPWGRVTVLVDGEMV